jgi:endonuclease-3 related protein
MLVEIYEKLLAAYGPQGWWPVTPPGELMPRYTGGPRNPAQRFEVAVGALLTQNTSWLNASRAIESLHDAGLLSPRGIDGTDARTLARLIRSAGYFNQKAKRLKVLAKFFTAGTAVTRDNLLGLEGIGPETADSILLYGFGKPFFVIDAYTRRIFERLGIVEGGIPYERMREIFERALPRDVRLYQEYHALLVEHAKRFCRKRPLCEECPLLVLCRAAERDRLAGQLPRKSLRGRKRVMEK